MGTPDGLAIAIKAADEHIKTHIPCSVHVIKNCEKDDLIESNLPSFLSLWTLINRNEPSLIAQIIMAKPISMLPSLRF